MDAQKVTFEFRGQKIALKASSDRTLVNEAIEVAMLKIQDAERRASTAPPHQIALLALLDLAEDYVRARNRAATHREEMIEKSSRLLELMDQEPV